MCSLWIKTFFVFAVNAFSLIQCTVDDGISALPVILMKTPALTLPVCWSVETVQTGGRGGEPEYGGTACLAFSAEAARWRNRSTLRPRRPLSAPSLRGAELRNPATAHRSLLGMEEVSTATGATASMIWLPFPTCCHLPSPVALTLQHCSTSASAACHPHLCWNRLKFNKR